MNALQDFGAKYLPLPRATLAKELLDLGCRKDVVDPRLPIYIEALLDAKLLDVSTLLAAVQPSPPDDGTVFESSLLDVGDSAKPSLQTIVLQLLTRKIANGVIAEDSELFFFLKHVLPWLTHFPSSVTLGFLVSATLGCPLAQEVLQGAKAKSLNIHSLVYMTGLTSVRRIQSLLRPEPDTIHQQPIADQHTIGQRAQLLAEAIPTS